MKIIKLGHCCLVVEVGGQKIMTDPGMFTRDIHEKVTGLTAILITHEHADHFHTESLAAILALNPTARVICNPGVGKLLDAAGIAHEVLADGAATDIGGVAVEAHGAVHARIHDSIPVAENTGFLIGGELWYPGDALSEMSVKPRVIALPLAGPWMKLSEAVDYCIALKPERCFAVHDFFYNDIGHNLNQRIAGSILENNGIALMSLDTGKEYDL